MKTALGMVKLEMDPIYGDESSETTAAAVSAVCAECECAIMDRYIMRVSGRSYHERCLKCTTCALKLDRSCFVWNAKLYCRQDYDKWVETKKNYVISIKYFIDLTHNYTEINCNQFYLYTTNIYLYLIVLWELRIVRYVFKLSTSIQL